MPVLVAETQVGTNAKMTTPHEWPHAVALEAGELTLEPLRVDHAAEMVGLLADERLHVHTGDRALSEPELRARYERQAVGHSPDGSAGWLNWVIREDGRAAGTVQATLTGAGAELAWVVGVEYQGRGVASRAAAAVMEWLRGTGVERFLAHIGPANVASTGVARRLGMEATDVVKDGEVRWVS
jgi:RimJ/RimL family protein N-acetyltransferase